jgi:hypothetical protein
MPRSACWCGAPRAVRRLGANVATIRGTARHYNRLAAPSDGVFAVATTLFVLDIRTPTAAAVRSKADRRAALTRRAPPPPLVSRL